MSCIYTGARVYFREYNATVPADLFQCGNQVLIQWEPEGLQYGYSDDVTHVVDIRHGYHHEKRGVSVTHETNVTGERR